jgi:hypothetical protein
VAGRATAQPAFRGPDGKSLYPGVTIFVSDGAGNAVLPSFGGGSGGGGAVTQSGTWQVNLGFNGSLVSSGNPLGVYFPTTPTVNLGALNGAATAALQSSLITALGSPLQQSGGSVGLSGTLPAFAATPTFNVGTAGAISTAALQSSVQGTVAAGAAPASMVVAGGVYNSTAPALTAGQSAGLQLDASGRLIVNAGQANTSVLIVPQSFGGVTLVRAINAAASTMSGSVKSSTGAVYHLSCTTSSSSGVYLRLYATGSVPTVGSGTPYASYFCSSTAPVVVDSAVGLNFSTGIGYTVTSGAADNDTTAITTAASVHLVIGYK